ncbi:hypothetical protein GCM10028857_06830 [Salinarchaeum chitinilyticum]
MRTRRLSVGYVGPDDAQTSDAVEGLRARDFPVDVAHETDDAVAFATEQSIDCLVVDHREAFDALAVLEAVQEIDTLLPLVVFPSAGSERLAARCFSFGVDDYVPQHEGIDALERALEDVRPASDPRRDAEGMLDALLGMVPRSLSIYFKDTAGRHVAVTEDFPGLIGPPYSETPDGQIIHRGESVLGKTDFDLYPTFLAEKTVEDEARILRSGEPMVDELERSQEADGTETFVSTSKAPWYDSAGTLRGIVGVTVDVTDREQHRRGLERQNDRLERFASVLSHDLRNPLGIAKGRVEQLEGDADAKADVHWALDRMEELINDVLELARQGSVVDDPELIDLADPARDAWDTVEGGSALELGDLPTVRGDHERLRALFENLFRNAVEHGSPDVSVRIDPHLKGVTVTDDGPGIPGDLRGNVFEHGFTTNDDGTGFGLSIVREIAEAHGWEIRAVKHDGGAQFLIEIE